MATEILVNDGGAPARILPFNAGANISAGLVCIMEADGDVNVAASAAATNTIGVSLTDADSGTTASIITGKGVIVNAYVSGTAASGALLQVGTTDGELAAGTTADAGVAVMVGDDTGSATSQLAKVLLI